MPLRKKVGTEILTSVGENHRSEPSTNHISMHFEGIRYLGGTAHCESKEMMVAIEELQRSQAAMWAAEFQSLHQEIAAPQAPQVPQRSLYLTREEDIHVG